MRFAFSLALCLAAQCAVAAPLDGRWSHSTPPYCGDEGDSVPLEIKGMEWDFYESGCTASALTGKIKLHCEGEGLEWDRNVAVTLAGDTLTVVDDGTTITYTRCPQTRE